MGAIVAGLQFLLGKVVAFATWIGSLFVKVFTALWDILRDVLVWIFDQFLSLAITILNAMDFSALTAHVGDWAQLPTSTLEVISAIGLSTAFGIIVTAIGIRIALQLVPFTRLGS